LPGEPGWKRNLKGSETIAFPPELQDDGDNSIADIKRDEQSF
jgi:hypothetical protein